MEARYCCKRASVTWCRRRRRGRYKSRRRLRHGCSLEGRWRIKSDGSYAEGLMGDTFKGKWKQTKKTGAGLTLEVVWAEEKKAPSVVEVAVIGKDHITVNY